jgi:23S rRNA pseudouridine1911/1915/1917 synthase
LKRLDLEVPDDAVDLRLDRALAQLLPERSRRSIRDLIEQGFVFVDGRRVKVASKLVSAGARLVVHEAPQIEVARDSALELVRLYEDEDVIVLDKPPGIHLNETETNAEPAVVEVLRAQGVSAYVVHRLDRETSGVVVLAKGKAVAAELGEKFQRREVAKRYWAVVTSAVEEGVIDAPIGVDRRRPRARTVHAEGKPSITEVRVLSELETLRLVEARPQTGRTHQIRVHLSHRGAPLFGDRLYGGLTAVRVGERIIRADRVMLHARSLEIAIGGTVRAFEAPVPTDFAALAEAGLALPGLSK